MLIHLLVKLNLFYHFIGRYRNGFNAIVRCFHLSILKKDENFIDITSVECFI
jgi:hypothetical protein